MDDIRIRYRFDDCARDGAGRADQMPTLVLSNSLGTNLAMWDIQIPLFTEHCRVLRYDTRGHGGSSAPAGEYTIERLARDVIGLLDVLQLERVHFCGLSMGGLIGMWLGARAPGRIDRLILCNTAPSIGTAAFWNTRIDAVRTNGLETMADGIVERWFSAGFRQRAPTVVSTMRAMLVANSDEGFAGSCAAVRDAGFWGELGTIGCPTLVIGGTHDVATPAADGAKMARSIRDARYLELDAGHLSNIEAAAAFTAGVLEFTDRGRFSARSIDGRA